MTKYIDAEKLKYEIERRKLSNYYTDTDDYEAELFEIIGSLQQEQPEESASDGLEEAADEHVNNIAYCGDDIELEKEQSKRDFIAGAKWDRSQMMKEAVETELYWDGDFLAIDLNMAALGYSERDKVRVIVCKKED